MKSLSRVQLFATPWTVAYQASLSMGFSRQEYWNGLPFLLQGDLPDPGIKPRSPALEADTLPSEPPLFTKSKYYFCSKLFSSQQILEIIAHLLLLRHPKKYTKKGNAKECSNYCTTALISHVNKTMLKNLKARLQQYVNWELPDVQAGFRKGRETRDQIANICWITEKARYFKKTSTSASLTMLKLWLCGSQQTVGNSLRDRNTMPVYLSLRSLYEGQEVTELDMEQQIGSKLGKQYIKAVYYTLLI